MRATRITDVDRPFLSNSHHPSLLNRQFLLRLLFFASPFFIFRFIPQLPLTLTTCLPLHVSLSSMVTCCSRPVQESASSAMNSSSCQNYGRRQGLSLTHVVELASRGVNGLRHPDRESRGR